VALEAAAETGIDKRFVYTMSGEDSSSQSEHLSIRCVLIPEPQFTIRLHLIAT
jgi:hypothetical protein